MVSSTPEVEWDDEERAWALALLDYEANKCAGCGGQCDETTDDDVDWEVPPPTRCFRCEAIATAQEPFHGQDATGRPKWKHPHALLWEAKRK